jgi:hypothetical protein
VAVLVAGQVDHPGQLLRAARDDVDVVPDVLVDTEDRHLPEPGRVGIHRLQQWLVKSRVVV